MRPVVVRLTAVSKAALNESCLIFALCETARFTGSKLMGAADISVSDADLDLLDAYLLSDQSPPECMLLSDLDGFLTGIAIGPELVMPSEWLPQVWGGEEPVFDDHVQVSAILGTIIGLQRDRARSRGRGVRADLLGERGRRRDRGGLG